MGIFLGTKAHKDICLGSKKHSVVYLGNKKMWRKESAPVINIWDSGVTDIGAYLRYANQVFNITGDLTSNAMTYFVAEPNTIYQVSLSMDTRFRLFSYAGQPPSGVTITNYVIHALDVNDGSSQNGAIKTLEITTGNMDTRVWIGYFSSGGQMSRLDVRNSILAIKL